MTAMVVPELDRHTVVGSSAYQPHAISQSFRFHADRRNGGTAHRVWDRECGAVHIDADIADGFETKRMIAAADIRLVSTIIVILMLVPSHGELHPAHILIVGVDGLVIHVPDHGIGEAKFAPAQRHAAR